MSAGHLPEWFNTSIFKSGMNPVNRFYVKALLELAFAIGYV